MGQSQSQDSPKAGSSSSPKREPSRSRRDGSQGRPSSARKATPIAPVPARVSVTPTTISASPSRRDRSTTSTSTTPTSRPESMGSSESKPCPSSRSSTLPNDEKRQAKPSPLSRPINVPAPGRDGLDETNYPSDSFGVPSSQFSRPPRLPLPIERDPEPTSPIITPQDLNIPLEQQNELGGALLPNRESMLSQTTVDDDDAADVEQFAADTDPNAPKVPTKLEWRGRARSVYVTGTFVGYDKKYRMHKDQDGKFSGTMPLATGTHHITFLVDGEPKTSTELPTTVDFANALVNYIEVAAPDSPVADETQPAESQSIPSAAGTERQGAEHVVGSADVPSEARYPGPHDELSSTLHETIVPPRDQDTKDGQTRPPQPAQTQKSQDQRPSAKSTAPKKRQPRPKYCSEIPEVLSHLDYFNNPDDERYRRASKAIQHLSQPPSLPSFMTKSILNATTPQKDDASVLTMPNHTVLNHLATSSIRNGVLATSGTTRYKRKFLTTIMYKPTTDAVQPAA